MHKRYIIILKCFQIIIASQIFYDFPYSIISSFQFLSCETAQIGQNNSGLKVQQITVYGWYNLKGNLDQDYLLFSGTNNPGDNIFALSYNPYKQQIRAKVFDQNKAPFDISNIFTSSMYNKWIFIRIGVNLNSNSSSNQASQIYFMHYVIYFDQYPNGNSPCNEGFDGSALQYNFDNKNFELFYGQNSYFPYSTACAYTKKVAILVGRANTKPNSYQLQQNQQEQSLDSDLRLQLNFSYTSSLNKIILNSAKNYPGFVELNTSFSNPLQYNTYIFADYFQAGEFNFEENGGIFLQFEFKLIEQGCVHFIPDIVVFETVNLNQPKKIFSAIKITDGCLSAYFNVQTNQNCYPIIPQQFNRITFVLTIQISQVVSLLYVGDNLVQKSYFPYIEIGQFTIKFQNQKTQDYPHPVSEYVNRQIYLKQIKLYQGTHFYQDNLCKMQMQPIGQNDCNMCNLSSDYLVQGKQQKCVQLVCPLNFQEIDLKKTCEWSDKTICPNVGQFKLFDINCECPDGQFLKNGKCQNCPENCITCLNEDQCNQYYSLNRVDGICKDNSFDDGKHCIQQFMKIINRKNTLGKLKYDNKFCSQQQQFGYQESFFQIKDSSFELVSSTQSFFIAFTFNFESSYPLIISQTYTLCFMLESKEHIFSLTIKIIQVTPSIKMDLVLTFFESQILSMPFEYNQDIWIGLYTNIEDVTVLVKQLNSPTSYYQAKIPAYKINQLKNPTFYLGGEVSPKVITDYPFCGKIVNSNYWILKGHQSMRQFLDVLKLQSYEDMDILYSFQLVQYDLDIYKLKRKIFDDFNQKQFISFTGPLINTNQLFGIEFDNRYKAKIELNNLNFLQFAIQFIFTPLAQPYAYTLASVIVNDQIYLISFRILANNFNEFSDFNICVYDLCRTLKYARIKYNVPNYICGFYYIDYDNTDPCFLYITREDMKCIHPKKDYALKEGKIIDQEQCNYHRNLNETVLFYNPFTLRCQDSLNIIKNCIQISYNNLNLCLKCSENIMNPANNCECPDGMYFSELLQKCDLCSPNCATCRDKKTNCTTCIYSGSNPPSCLCPNENEYLDKNYTCQPCDPQCATCSNESFMCKTCSQNRIFIPECICDPKNFINDLLIPISNPCIPITCDFQCLTCEYSSNNCKLCRGNRVSVPECQCGENQYEASPKEENCRECKSDFYYDKEKQSCQECDLTCGTCYGGLQNNCKTCKENLFLTLTEECKCPTMTDIYIDINTKNIQCLEFMDVLISVKLINDIYHLEIEFEQSVDNLDMIIKTRKFNDLMLIRVNELPENSISFINPKIIQDNKIMVQLQINRSFSSVKAFSLFKETNIFKNEFSKKILNPIYKTKQFEFRIGPYMFDIDERNTSLKDLMKKLTVSDSPLMQTVKGLQMIFYILNSIQPTSMFLLVKINLPINFYYFLRSIAIYVFKTVPEYQQIEIQQSSDFQYKLMKNYTQSTKVYQFDSLGFNNLFLLNSGTIFCKYLIIIIAIGILVYKSSFNSKKLKDSKIGSVKNFFVCRLCQENEINLLMVVFSICIQYDNIDSGNAVNRWNLYACILISAIYMYSFVWFFFQYNECQDVSTNSQLDHISAKLKQNMKQENNYVVINYFFIQQFKKIVLVLGIYSFYYYPIVVCAIGITLNILSATLTFKYRPYQNLMICILKGLGDLLLLVTWILMVIFYKFQQKFYQDVEVSESDIIILLKQGFFASICLLIFNAIYLFIFLYELIFSLVKIIPTKRKTVLVINKVKQQQDLDNIDYQTYRYGKDKDKFMSILYKIPIETKEEQIQTDIFLK